MIITENKCNFLKATARENTSLVATIAGPITGFTNLRLKRLGLKGGQILMWEQGTKDVMFEAKSFKLLRVVGCNFPIIKATLGLKYGTYVDVLVDGTINRLRFVTGIIPSDPKELQKAKQVPVVLGWVKNARNPNDRDEHYHDPMCPAGYEPHFAAKPAYFIPSGVPLDLNTFGININDIPTPEYIMKDPYNFTSIDTECDEAVDSETVRAQAALANLKDKKEKAPKEAKEKKPINKKKLAIILSSILGACLIAGGAVTGILVSQQIERENVERFKNTYYFYQNEYGGYTAELSTRALKRYNIKNLSIPENYEGFPVTGLTFDDGLGDILESLYLTNNIKILENHGYSLSNFSTIENIYFKGTLGDWANIEFNFGESGHAYFQEFTVTSYDSGSNLMRLAKNFYVLDANGDVTYEENTYRLVDEIKETDIIHNMSAFCFSENENIKKVTIGASQLYGVNLYSFYFCKNLKEVDLSKSNIGILYNGAFAACHNLESILLPSNLTHIGHNVFNGCKNLKKITLPASLKEIGMWAFMCENLTDVTYLGTVSNFITMLGSNGYSTMKFNSGLTIKCTDGEYITK